MTWFELLPWCHFSTLNIETKLFVARLQKLKGINQCLIQSNMYTVRVIQNRWCEVKVIEIFTCNTKYVYIMSAFS